MGQLLGIVIPLAAGAAISPTVLTMQLITLSRPVSPVARGWAVAMGYTAILLVEVVIGLMLAKGTGGSDTPSETTAWIKLAAAVILLALGVRALRAAPKEEKRDEPESDAPRLLRYAAIGGALMITNVTTTVLFLPAIHDVGVADVELAAKVAVIAIVVAIVAVPAGGPPLAVSLMGSRANVVLAKLNGFTTRHRRGINAGICFGFSAFLAAVSLPDLL